MSDLKKTICDNVVFNKATQSFTIIKGSKGTYAYKDVLKARVVNEDAKHYGSDEIFKHTVLADYFQPWGLHPKKVYVGLDITLTDEKHVYLYISEIAKEINTLDYHSDRHIGEDLREKFIHIKAKYHTN